MQRLLADTYWQAQLLITAIKSIMTQGTNLNISHTANNE